MIFNFMFQPKKSVFSGFGGFNKTQPASFDFLSKLTNGSNENSSNSKVDSSVTSSLFTSKPLTTSPGTGLFSLQTSSSVPTKSPFGSPSTLTGASSLFGVSSTNTTSSSNLFVSSKADSTVGDSPFKIQTVTSSTDNKTDTVKSTTTLASTKFDIPTNSAIVAKSLFSTTSNSSPFKIQPVSDTVQSNFAIVAKTESKPNETETKKDHDKNESKLKYYSKLKGLNESVSDWIKKHVEQTPLCILTPIFKDYEKYLKEIQDEYQGSENDKKQEDKAAVVSTEMKTEFSNINDKPIATTTNSSTTGSSLFSVSPNSKSLFTPQDKNNATIEKPASFSFGVNPSSSVSSSTTKTTTGFTFGVASTSSPTTATTISSPFAIGTTSSTFSFNTNTNASATNGSAAPFSFGIGKPFSFNSSIKQATEPKTEETNKEDEDDTPPKVEYTPVVEENSVYDKKCKIFVKKDGNFVDKGVGTLYIKKVEDSGKHQLLVRANTNLGTILVNLILVSAIPTQRMGKNNVMLVYIPTPDSKPPPTPILIRVKTSEEADELLTTLDKYKT